MPYPNEIISGKKNLLFFFKKKLKSTLPECKATHESPMKSWMNPKIFLVIKRTRLKIITLFLPIHAVSIGDHS